MNQTHFQIVSPPMPVGVTWLINVLLELGVRTTLHGSHWRESPEGSQLGPLEKWETLIWHLPALHRQRAFHFQPGLEAFWDHRLSFAQYPARKTILFVRDLRDTIYSHMCRQLHPLHGRWTTQDLLARLAEPEIWTQYFPLLFDLPAADTLAYFLCFWLNQVQGEQLLVVSFEDSKQNPQLQVQRVLRFLGIQRSQELIDQALAHSELRLFQEIKRWMEQQTLQNKIINRKGQINEWQSAIPPEFRPDFLAHFKGPGQKLLQILKYTPWQETAQLSDQRFLVLRRELVALLEQNQLAQAWQWLQHQMMNQDRRLLPLLGGQMLALLWTRAIVGPAQLHLPSSARMAQLFAGLNAEFADSKALQAAVLRGLNPNHALHQIQPPPFWQADTNKSLAEGVAEARAQGQSLLLWQQPGIQLEVTGLFQMLALLDGRDPALAAVMPILEPASGVSFAERTWQRHAHWGAEFQPVELAQLPPCILFQLEWLTGLNLNQPAHVWLKPLRVQQALGVLAQST